MDLSFVNINNHLKSFQKYLNSTYGNFHYKLKQLSKNFSETERSILWINDLGNFCTKCTRLKLKTPTVEIKTLRTLIYLRFESLE